MDENISEYKGEVQILTNHSPKIETGLDLNWCQAPALIVILYLWP